MIQQSHRKVIDGVDLHWTERGEGGLVVILHGLADSQHTWATVADELGKTHRVLCLDLPGCGLSARPDAAYGINWQARLVAAWLDALRIHHCDLFGHSYGGGVALWLLLHRAGAVRKLGLIAAGGLGIEVSPMLRLAALCGLFEGPGERLIGPITRWMLHRYGGNLTAAERRHLLQLNSRPGTARAFGRTVRDVIDWRGQTRHILQHIHQVPVLPSIGLFWGDRDRVIPAQHGELLCSLFENCTLWRIADAGHFLHWEAPHALASAMKAYLDEPIFERARLNGRGTPKHRPIPSTSRCDGLRL